MDQQERLKNKEKYEGLTKENNFGSLMKIFEYRNSKSIDVIFLDNNYISKNRELRCFQKGAIESPYEKRTFGIGYIGEGKYHSSDNGKATKTYVTWKGIMERCYSVNKINIRPTYTECTVCEDWHNFQNFAKWYYENYYEIDGEKMCLDKDILIKGNKVYSSETCIFVPNRINVLFTKSNAQRGDLPIGVNKVFNTTNKIYHSCCSIFKNNKKAKMNLGYFDNPDKAFNTYKNFKENYIKQVADEYKNQIPQKLYDAMYNYQVEITD